MCFLRPTPQCSSVSIIPSSQPIFRVFTLPSLSTISASVTTNFLNQTHQAPSQRRPALQVLILLILADLILVPIPISLHNINLPLVVIFVAVVVPVTAITVTVLTVP